MDKIPETEKKAQKMRGENLVPFLAHLEKVRAEVEQGWPIKSIYNRYAETLDMSYPQFSRYVKRYIGNRSVQAATVPSSPEKQITPPLPASTPAQKKQETDKISKQPSSAFKGFIPGPKEPDPADLW